MSTILYPEYVPAMLDSSIAGTTTLDRECHEHMSLHPGLVGFAFPNLWFSVVFFFGLFYISVLSLFILHDHAFVLSVQLRLLASDYPRHI